uniref:Cation/H+ exchanger transmembrane domain-containing protein n=1 Tax=Ananas comosus var. bracteatus TaxID=296719 RepID=A0A6V7PRP8_ANACO|nr:unnamed protein product [Ananas comosus var. bracteatus]
MGFDVGAHLVRLGIVSSTSDHASVVSINIFVALLCSCIVIGHLLEENRWMNESITALIIIQLLTGVCTGVVILLTTKGKARIFSYSVRISSLFTFSRRLYSMRGKEEAILPQFHDNHIVRSYWNNDILFHYISWAIEIFKRIDVGSLDVGDFLGLNICLHFMVAAIGAIFSATDSVCTLQVLNQDETPFLYSLVFGEGVVNDATSVVLFNALQDFDINHVDAITVLKFVGNFFYLFLTSTFLGVFAGLLSAYIIKKLYIGRHSTDREVALMILMAYLSYMLAELLDLSGILTVFFCGIVMSHYAWHNVTESSRITTKHVFATMSFIAETFLFLYVGMDALDIEKWKFTSDSPGNSIGVSSILLGLVLVGRAAFVFPLSFLSNLTKRSPEEKINFRKQIIIWWAGLMRGAVSIALAYNKFTRSGHTQLRGNAIMITSTITVVLFSTMVFGLLTKPLIRLLLPASSRNCVISEPTTPKSLLSPLSALSRADGKPKPAAIP